jgi:succinate dehydrogenase/fumarate reductase flavoprotein subunit
MTDSLPARSECDLVVVGSGAAGLATAVTAAWLGLEVIVVEKEDELGGTTAWSGGWLWIPRNPLAIAAGIVEDIDAPARYLRHELGTGYDDARIAMFLVQGPRMVSFFIANTDVAFVDGNAIPDFHDTPPGAGSGGRSVCAAPFDGRELGPRIRDIKPPLAEISPFGMGIASGADLRHFLDASRKLGSALHAARRLVRHWLDLVRHRRGMHLVAGNALVARLVKSADKLGVCIIMSTPVSKLIVANGRVAGVVAGAGGAGHEIHARRGVVLAAGGFPHDVERKAELFPHAPTGREHHSAAPESNTGDGLRLAEAAGGAIARDLPHAGAWAPVSLVPRADGAVGRFPHLIERAKPGLIMVRADGRRFANEANSYHDLMQALFAATPSGEACEAWLVCDHAFIRRYGLGRARPRPFPLRPWLRNGYLRRGNSPEALARACGISIDGLAATLRDYNSDAVHGQDPRFGRGGSAYNRVQGDAGHQPNPCVAPIVQAPFYAVRIVPGSLGTFAGIRTDAHARALDGAGEPIEGLYAVGSDMSSIMAGRYPAGGITLGPAMTFGYIAAHHVAGVPLDNNRTQAAAAAER